MTRLPGLFVVSTDTGVGKTHVVATIARTWTEAGRRVGVLKPVATGATFQDGRWVSEDGESLRAAIGGNVPPDRVVPFLYEEPLAPCVAARRSGSPLGWGEFRQSLGDALVWWATRADVMVVEGVGGLLCPLTDGTTVADLALLLDYPLVIVAHRGLGTMNHTLMTVEAARVRGLRVAGVLLNGARPTTDPVAEATNGEELSRRLDGVAILGEWLHGVPLPGPVVAEVATWYDWAMMSRSVDPAHAGRIDRPGSDPMSSDTQVPAEETTPAEIPPPEREPEVSPVPLLAPGSQDDSFLDSPNAHRFGPDLPDSAANLIAMAAIDTRPAMPAQPPASDDEWEEVGPTPRASWPMVVLASYASAVTLALAWILFKPGDPEVVGKRFALAPEPAKVEVPAEEPRGRRVTVVPALPADRVVPFGKTLRVGSLEITPIAAKRENVKLRRVGVAGDVVERPGLAGTIVLRIRLHNVTSDLAFAPLDPTFVRQVGSEIPDTFAESPSGERIYPYPLAVASEMGLAGQDFTELRPGETRVVAIVTAPDVSRVAPESLTWRLKLRTGIDQVEAIGVSPSAAKPE